MSKFWKTIFPIDQHSLTDFWTASYRFKRTDPGAILRDGEALYKFQCDRLAASLLLKDNNPNLSIDTHDLNWKSIFNWINKGELMAGSFIASEVSKACIGSKGFEVNDIDIYFKCKADAVNFCIANNMIVSFSEAEAVCVYFVHKNFKFNLIWGISYDSPEQLISQFDIRACSMCYDPNSGRLYSVNGAIDDAIEHRIIFNPVPRATSIARIIKYTQKGFLIDKYQRVFFAELVRSDIYSSELELKTGYEVKPPIY